MKTFYNRDDNTIEIVGSISSFEIYDSFFEVLNQHMIDEVDLPKEDKKPPTISFEKVSWIDAHAIPILLSIGTFLKKYYKEGIEIKLPYSPRVISYLKVSKFFDYAGDSKSGIFKYDRNLLGLDFYYNKKLNQEYIVDRLPPIVGYYKLSKKEQLEKKYFTSDKLKDFYVPRLTENLFPKDEEEAKRSATDKYIFYKLDKLYEAIAEIMCNAMLYTDSYSYTCIQKLSRRSNYPGIYLSISDSGRGFARSLDLRPQERINMIEWLEDDLKEKITIDSKIYVRLGDYFSIYEALYTSASNARINLWKLITIVIGSAGVIRVHNNKTQIVFNMNNRCYNCKKQRECETTTGPKEVVRCMNCMVRNYSSDKRISQLRLFKAKLQGVHIEIDFPVE